MGAPAGSFSQDTIKVPMTHSSDDEARPRAPRPWIRFSEALATVICERISQGESLMEICRDEDMPARCTVQAWRRQRPAFRDRLAEAFRRGRHNPNGGRRNVWHPQVAALILQRVAAGMTLTQACDLPSLPSPTTVYGWLAQDADFFAAYRRARLCQAHRRFDQVWEIAEAATPATVTVARLQIGAAQWQAARLAPTKYGAQAEGVGAVDAEPPPFVRIMNFGARPGEPLYEDVPFLPAGSG